MWRAVPPWLVLAGSLIVFGAALARRTLRNRPALAPLMCGVAVAALTMVGMLDRFRAVDQSRPIFGRKVDAIVPPGECIELTGTEDRETGAYTGIAAELYYIHREPASVAQRPTRYRIVYSARCRKCSPKRNTPSSARSSRTCRRRRKNPRRTRRWWKG